MCCVQGTATGQYNPRILHKSRWHGTQTGSLCQTLLGGRLLHPSSEFITSDDCAQRARHDIKLRIKHLLDRVTYTHTHTRVDFKCWPNPALSLVSAMHHATHSHAHLMTTSSPPANPVAHPTRHMHGPHEYNHSRCTSQGEDACVCTSSRSRHAQPAPVEAHTSTGHPSLIEPFNPEAALRPGIALAPAFADRLATTRRHCRSGSHSNCRPADRPCVSAHACTAPHAGARDAPLRRTHRHSAGCGRASHCRARCRRLHPVAVTAPK